MVADGIVAAFSESPQLFGAGVGLIQRDAEFGRDHSVLFGNDKCDGPIVVPQRSPVVQNS